MLSGGPQQLQQWLQTFPGADHWCYSFQLGAPTPWDSEMYILLTPHCDSLTYDDG